MRIRSFFFFLLPLFLCGKIIIGVMEKYLGYSSEIFLLRLFPTCFVPLLTSVACLFPYLFLSFCQSEGRARKNENNRILPRILFLPVSCLSRKPMVFDIPRENSAKRKNTEQRCVPRWYSSAFSHREATFSCMHVCVSMCDLRVTLSTESPTAAVFPI